MIIANAVAQAGQPPAAWLAAQGMLVEEPVVDGKIGRCRHSCSPTGSAAGWYWIDPSPAPHGACGCWRCDHRANYSATDLAALPEEARRSLRAKAAAREAEIEAEHEIVSEQLTAKRRKLDFAPPDHPYLVAKGVKPHGALILDGNLILPLVDISGKIWSAQGISIGPVREWGGRTKSFESGGKIQGTFFPIGPVATAGVVLVCEGFATGATLHEATDLPVCCAMSANNLKPVASAIAKHNPAAAVVVCADNDRHTPGNPGVTKAEEACLAVQCGIAIPDFGTTPPASDASDFNDLARIAGIEAVRNIVLAQVPPEKPPLVYDNGRATWWTKNARGEFVLIGADGARRQLKANGFSSRQGKDDLLSSLDAEMNRLVRFDGADYVGPVAGWPVGIHFMGGRRVLVTSTATLYPGGDGRCDTLLAILGAMLGDDQLSRLCLWLACARRRLATRKWHPMPALALVGPPACGKSLLQHAITLLLGGRTAKPAQFLQGVTPFNSDLFGAEHLSFEDESARCDGPSRRHLGEQIKALLFCRQVQCHAKHRQAVTLEPFWVLTMSLNDEAEHLMVFPPIDDSLRDKILLLACEWHPRPVPAGEEETQWLERMLAAELGPFADMLDRLDPAAFPEAMRDPRTVVRGWQHPEILGRISDLAPEIQLLGLIDDTVFAGENARVLPWVGSAEQLSRELRTGPYGREAERLLSWTTACGVYLARLAVRMPGRVSKIESRTREDGQARKWRIHPAQT